MEIKRIGYGSNFNKISINYKQNLIKKECIDDCGKTKINNEKQFYNYVINKNITFGCPKIINFLDNGYIMEYLTNYLPLYKIIYNMAKINRQQIILDIIKSLELLHSIDKLFLSKEEFFDNIHIEIHNKNIERYNLIKTIICKDYSFITKINGMQFLSFEQTLELLNKNIINLIKKRYLDNYYFVLIHGDCQFNNILYNSELNKYIFIDPRGYFGNISIFGLKEYDYAKLYFALSGYDEFDNREINNLDIQENNIIVNINYIEKDILNSKKYDELSILLMLNIWLGNAQCFMKKNKYKAIYSFYIALYLSNLYLNTKKINF